MRRKHLRKRLLSKSLPNSDRSVVASAQANRVKWKDGDISGKSETKQGLPITPVRGILKRSASSPGRKMHRAAVDRPTSAGVRSAAMNEFGSPKWNWNGPRPWEDSKRKPRPRSAVIRTAEIEFRPQNEHYIFPKVRNERVLPVASMPVERGETREEK